MSARRFHCALIACFSMAGCMRVDEPVVGRYRATVATRGGELPFLLDVARENEHYVVYVINGEERIRIEGIRVNEGELIATFPGNQSTLRARLSRRGMKGTLTVVAHDGSPRELPMPLRARLGETHRFYAESLTDNADVEGRWEVEFTTTTGNHSSAIAVFEQEHDRVSGTITTRAGERQAVEGQVHDSELKLSALTGTATHLYNLQVTRSGEIEGEYWRGDVAHAVQARRNADATLGGEQTLQAALRFKAQP
jgi:hypothetical protein